MSHQPDTDQHCGFCIALTRLRRELSGDARAWLRAQDALWDQYERAGVVHRAYGRRRGYHR